MELTSHRILLVISFSNTFGDSNNLFMPVIRIQLMGRFYRVLPLTRVLISSSSLSSKELKMKRFEVKVEVMTNSIV